MGGGSEEQAPSGDEAERKEDLAPADQDNTGADGAADHGHIGSQHGGEGSNAEQDNQDHCDRNRVNHRTSYAAGLRPRRLQMHSTSVSLLLIAAGTVGFLHSILPDHWVPLAVVARTQRWSIFPTARISLLASIGHVLTSIVLGGIIALVGLQFRSAFVTQQGHIVGVVLVLTGLGFLIWGLTGHGHHHHEHEDGHDHDHDHDHDHGHDHQHAAHGAHLVPEGTLLRRFAGIAVPFGAAASPDLTILPVFLAASAAGIGTVVGVLITFSLVTLATFVVLTVLATLAGYQIKGEWLETNGNTITAIVLIGIGIAVYLGV